MTSYSKKIFRLAMLLATGALLVSPGPLAASPGASAPGAADFNGGRAFEDLKKLVGFGPRPAGSKALGEAREWMVHELEAAGWKVERDSFLVSTPAGSVAMTNLIAKLPGARPKVVMVAGHYDTKLFEEFKFVGANDGGSSAALLLELARELPKRKNNLTTWLVFFDGEEAVRQWTATDSLYGSRHLVSKLAASGELSRIEAMILVDMIADTQLTIERDTNSTQWLVARVASVAQRLGYSKYFPAVDTTIFDDHNPFVNAGVSAVDLIDLDYGPNRSYWHTAEDTVEHCSPSSLTIVGRVVSALLDDVEKTPRTHEMGPALPRRKTRKRR